MTISPIFADATDLTDWARRRDAQATLPQLLRRLILATADDVLRAEFRAGEGVQLGGWDGIAQSLTGNAFVPPGVSGWETGCGEDVKGKADDDYAKRSRDPLGLEASLTTFVFVTPRRWGNKQAWAAEKRKDGIWTDVKAYDADDLHTWLEEAPAVHIWLSILVGRRPLGVEDVASLWREWSNVTEPPLSGAFVTAGRKPAVDRLQAWLSGPPSALAVQGETRDEAAAFLAAAAGSLPDTTRDLHLARTIVVRDAETWRTLVAARRPLVLVPTFADRSRVTAAVADGHHVLIPLDTTEPPVGQTIELERPRRTDAKTALEATGVAGERAERLAVVGRASLGALRRALARHPAALIPSWAQGDAVGDVLSALLAGRWSDDNEADREILSSLAGRPYQEYREVLARLAREPDPPVRLIGTAWTVVAKDDAWALLAPAVTEDRLARLEAAVLRACGEADPKFELVPDERWKASVLAKAPKHSALVRQGLADTLALMASYSDVFPLRTSQNGQAVASRIVRRLLEQATTWQFWASLGGQLRPLAEASPDIFLDAVERGLSGEPPMLGGVFEDGNPTFSTSPHTELLWALETVAWAPEYLGRATFMLAKLALIDPGGKTMNRPARSLHEIFLPWHPSTAADVDRRLRVLDALRKREPKIAWGVLFGLVPSRMGVAMSTAKPRRRDWAPEQQCEVTMGEFGRIVTQTLAWLREDAGADASRWTRLIGALNEMPEPDFDQTVKGLASLDPDAIAGSDRLAIWEALRDLIARHREFTTADWALPEDDIARLEEVYERFEPVEPVEKFSWLFGRNPQPPKCRTSDWRARQELVATMQAEATSGLLANVGLDAVLSLAGRVERPRDVGVALAGSSPGDDEVLERTLASANPALREVGFGFLVARASADADWLERLRSSGTWWRWSSGQRSDCLLVQPFAPRTWDLVAREDEEVRRLYWTQVSILGRGGVSSADRDLAARKFAEYGQLATAVGFLGLYAWGNDEPIDRKLVATLLEAVARGENRQANVDWGSLAYAIAELLAKLEGSPEVEEARVARLEWLFLPLLHHYRPARVLQKALATDPSLFVEVLKLVYKGRNEERAMEAPAEARNRAMLGYELLREWKTPPGFSDDGAIDASRLREWVRAARELAAATDRAEVADLHIGQVLANFRAGSDGAWPHEAVRDLIEEVASDKIEHGIDIGIYNSRGVITRGIWEGGGQERAIAERYRGYARSLADRWPRTSRLMRQIAESYESDARRQDVHAELEEALET